MENETVVESIKDEFRFKEVTVQELLNGYEKGEYTTEEVVQSYLERIEKFEDTYNAFTFMNPNALEEAKKIDLLRAKGENLGPLAGIPIVIKEAVDVAGIPTTFGWAPLCKKAGGIELIPTSDASIVTRLKEAGAVILGKTNIPAFSASGTNTNTSWDGPTLNAVNPILSPGGSSTGTATAVSGNFAVLGIAEETGGSIQIPAAAQALVGIKPSFGLVPTRGVTPLGGSTRDVLGPHARTVEDAALMLDIIAGYSEADPKTKAAADQLPYGGYRASLDQKALQGKRLGLYGPGWRQMELSEETQKLYAREIKELEKLGAEVVADPFAGSGLLEFLASTGKDAFAIMLAGLESFFHDLDQYLKDLDPNDQALSLENVFARAGQLPWAEGQPLHMLITALGDPEEAIAKIDKELDLTEFNHLKNGYLLIINEVMTKHQLDGFVFPQMAKATPPLGKGAIEDQITAIEGQITTVSEINISGLPLITVPAGYYENGSPFALAFFAEMWSEAKLIGMAYSYEQATKHREATVLNVTPPSL